MKYGLKDHIIQQIQKVFSDFPLIEEVILYGSRAKGNYKPGSDIDFTLQGKDLDLSALNKISLALDDLFLPYTFDLSIYKHIDSDDLLDHIKRVGICFYKKRPR